MRAFTKISAAVVMIAAAPAFGQAVDEVASGIGDQWIGHDAADMLVQWPINSGFSIAEIPGTKETVYTWNFGAAAQSYDNTYMAPVGEGPGGLIMETRSDHVEKPERHDCRIDVYVDAHALVTRYTYTGPKCRLAFRAMGAPKN